MKNALMGNNKNKIMKRISTFSSSDEVFNFIKDNGTNCQFVSILTQTPVVKIKSGNPWGANKNNHTLFKISKKIGIINANYNNSVKKKIAEKLGISLKDVEYTPCEIWYVHLMTNDGKPLPIVEHKTKKGEYYLQYFPHKSKNIYIDKDKNSIDFNAIKPWLYKESEKPDYKPSVICVNIKNILQLKASGSIIESDNLDEIESLLDT